ncbi:hypothetical protein CEXT_119381 [Caerostris extrusa]|uniref:Ribosomal protein S10 n=1 Tax=Caerostris extrusa TaxID=172846 RepID=A0AAV4UJL0_CAEEX|nr:hypothetical protein CEXT_119381 [Caerostris extrusa]
MASEYGIFRLHFQPQRLRDTAVSKNQLNILHRYLKTKQKIELNFEKQTQSCRIPRNISKDLSEISPKKNKTFPSSAETIFNLRGGAETIVCKKKGMERKQNQTICENPCFEGGTLLQNFERRERFIPGELLMNRLLPREHFLQLQLTLRYSTHL